MALLSSFSEIQRTHSSNQTNTLSCFFKNEEPKITWIDQNKENKDFKNFPSTQVTLKGEKENLAGFFVTN